MLPQLQSEQTPPLIHLRFAPKPPFPFPRSNTNNKVRIVIVSHRLQRNSVRFRLVALAIRMLRRQADLQHCFSQISVGDSGEPGGKDVVAVGLLQIL